LELRQGRHCGRIGRRLSGLLGKLHPSKVDGEAEKTEHGYQRQRDENFFARSMPTSFRRCGALTTFQRANVMRVMNKIFSSLSRLMPASIPHLVLVATLAQMALGPLS